MTYFESSKKSLSVLAEVSKTLSPDTQELVNQVLTKQPLISEGRQSESTLLETRVSDEIKTSKEKE